MDEIRYDGYMNMLTGVGTERDPTQFTTYRADPVIPQPILESIFESDGIGRRIIEMPAEEMCRGWFDITGEGGEEVQDYLETLRAQQAFIESTVWARLYGGALLYIILDDGRNESQPVNLQKIQKVVGVQAFDRHCVSFEPFRLSQDPVKRLLGLPEVYSISPPRVLGNTDQASQILVHESRVVLLPGRRVDLRRRMLNGGWDASVLQSAWNALQRYASGMGYANNILRDFVQAVLSVKDLTAMIASGREDVVQRRIQLLDMSRSILNAMVIDADGEEYNKSSSSVAGLADILDRFGESLSASVSIPVAKLFGRSAAGLNSTGEHDLRNYYDMLAAEQNRVLNPVAETLVKYIFLAKDGPTGGVEPEDWSVRWRSLMAPSEKETADLRKVVADTDKIYLDSGVLSPEEVAESRFGSDEWSMETQLIDSTDRKVEAAGSEEDVEKGIESQKALMPENPADEEKTDHRDEAGDDPEPLYISRPVLNKKDFSDWAEAQGLTLDTSELHVTILYSRSPIDWFSLGFDWSGNDSGLVTIPAGGPRRLAEFGDVVVLRFGAHSFEWRHQQLIDLGGSHDFPEYKPHVTLPGIPADAEPYTGKIVFGPEEFAPLRLHNTDEAMNQPRAPKGASNGGQWIKAGSGSGASVIKPPKSMSGAVGKVWQLAKENPHMSAKQLAETSIALHGTSPATAKKQAYLAKKHQSQQENDPTVLKPSDFSVTPGGAFSPSDFTVKGKTITGGGTEKAKADPTVQKPSDFSISPGSSLNPADFTVKGAPITGGDPSPGYVHKSGLSDEAMVAMNKAAVSVASKQYPAEKILALKDKDPKTLTQYEKKKLLAYKKELGNAKAEMKVETKTGFDKDAIAHVAKNSGPAMQPETVEKLVSGEWKPDPGKPWQQKAIDNYKQYQETGQLNVAPHKASIPKEKLSSTSIRDTPPPITNVKADQTSLVKTERVEASVAQAVASYTGSGYFKINQNLRNGKPDQHADKIDRAIAASRAEKDMVVVRGFSHEAYTKLAQQSGKSSLTVGDTFQDLGYVSTTRKADVAVNFGGTTGWAIKVNVPKGSNILAAKPFSYHKDEDEFILPRGTKFKITAVHEDTNILMVDIHH